MYSVQKDNINKFTYDKMKISDILKYLVIARISTEKSNYMNKDLNIRRKNFENNLYNVNVKLIYCIEDISENPSI